MKKSSDQPKSKDAVASSYEFTWRDDIPEIYRGRDTSAAVTQPQKQPTNDTTSSFSYRTWLTKLIGRLSSWLPHT